MATTTTTEGARTQSVVLHGIRWSTYEALLEEVGDQRIRLTYDRGELEIMTPSPEHETFKSLIGRMVETMTEELGVAIRTGGSTTIRNQLLERGLEPDECYWVQNEPRVRGRRKLDLAKDPPPDVAIEVEVSRSALDRLGIYASLGIGEVWRWTGSTIVCHVLEREGGRHVEVARSRCFPFLAPSELASFLADTTVDETTWIRGFRQWVARELRPRLDRA